MCSLLMAGDGEVRIKWSCGHEGYVNLDWLKRHSYSSHALETRKKKSYPQLEKQVWIIATKLKGNANYG